jgi:hypothetical protein
LTSNSESALKFCSTRTQKLLSNNSYLLFSSRNCPSSYIFPFFFQDENKKYQRLCAAEVGRKSKFQAGATRGIGVCLSAEDGSAFLHKWTLCFLRLSFSNCSWARSTIQGLKYPCPSPALRVSTPFLSPLWDWHPTLPPVYHGPFGMSHSIKSSATIQQMEGCTLFLVTQTAGLSPEREATNASIKAMPVLLSQPLFHLSALSLRKLSSLFYQIALLIALPR